MLSRLIYLLPPGLIRFLGQLQFKVPFLRPLLRGAANRFAAREGVIKYGVGAGLKFDATGGNAGYLLGTTEPEEQAALAQVLREGNVFYDLGANIGFYSTLAARIVGPSGQVYAFEPFPESAAAARRNAEMNDFSNVQVIEAAVSDAPGTLNLTLGEAARNHKLDDSSGGDGIKVACVRLDAYIRERNLRLPNVVMIDIEGAEIKAMQGMAEAIRAARPVILCEVHWLIGELHDFYNAELKPLGYSLQTLTGDPLPTEPVRYHVIMRP